MVSFGLLISDLRRKSVTILILCFLFKERWWWWWSGCASRELKQVLVLRNQTNVSFFVFSFFIKSFLFNCIFIHILTHKRYRKQFLTTPSRDIQCLSLSSQCLASSSSYRLSLSSTTEVSVFPVQIKVRPFRGCCWPNIRCICLILLYFRSINVNYSVVCTLVFLLLSPSSPPVCLLGFIFVFAFIITKISKLKFLPLIGLDF